MASSSINAVYATDGSSASASFQRVLAVVGVARTTSSRFRSRRYGLNSAPTRFSVSSVARKEVVDGTDRTNKQAHSGLPPLHSDASQRVSPSLPGVFWQGFRGSSKTPLRRGRKAACCVVVVGPCLPTRRRGDTTDWACKGSCRPASRFTCTPSGW